MDWFKVEKSENPKAALVPNAINEFISGLNCRSFLNPILKKSNPKIMITIVNINWIILD
tara:strand:- start:1 stop:177 length:177 start_codon:yes stop_codon:yes gene_type:complete